MEIRQISLFLWIYTFMTTVNGHARLVDPPGRASMFRYGYNTPVDYNDNQIFCGGYNIQHFVNGGKCGVCGDEYGITPLYQPPGRFATGIITQTYNMNANVTMRFEITASHRGYLEFRICPNNDVTKAATQECLDRYLLQDAKTGGTKFYFNYGTVGVYDAQLTLPVGLTCSQCVVQWKYHTGNSWGCVDDDITKDCAIGLGRQEEFYACADVAIVASDAGNVPSTSQTTTRVTSISQTSTQGPTSTSASVSQPTTAASPTTEQTTRIPTTTRSIPTASTTTVVSVQNCVATGPYKGDANVDSWCRSNCKIGYCPDTHCSRACLSTLRPTSILSTTTTTKSTTTKSTTSTTLPQTTQTSTSAVTSIVSSSSSVPTGSSYCPPLDQYSHNPSIVDWCINSCINNYCSPFLCKCTSNPPTSTTLSSLIPVSTTTEAPPTTSKEECIGAGVWRNDTAMASWCTLNCNLGHCPPSTCQCSKSGTLQDLSFGLGDKCYTVMTNISRQYEMYMDLWCKHNCPSFGCWNIPNICRC